jgi:hypothetical protein
MHLRFKNEGASGYVYENTAGPLGHGRLAREHGRDGRATPWFRGDALTARQGWFA